MNKALKEKLLFITGGAVAIFGLVVLQQNFPSSLDSSKFLAQVPGENTYEECISDPTKIIQNGDFEQFLTGATGPSFSLSTLVGFSEKEVCFFEGLSFSRVLFDSLIESNVLRLFYVRHVYDGNPDYPMFDSSESQGAVQLVNIEPGYYEINFKSRVQPGLRPIMLYIGFSDSVIQKSNAFLLDGCAMYDTDLPQSSHSFTRLNMFEDCVLSQFDYYTQVLIDSIDYQDYVAQISILNSDVNYIYFMPIGLNEDWLVQPWVNLKPNASVFLDDILINSAHFTCGITFQGEGELYYSNLDGEYVQHNGGSIDIESIGNQYPENVDEDSFYLYSPAPGILNVKAPTNVQFTDADILELFSLQGANVISAISFSGSNFWIEYECLIACSELQEDFNQDGIVDQADVEAFLPFFGQSCSNLETCQFDLDNDGIITVQDMMILIGSVGEQCGVPISAPSPDSDETNEPENTTYDSQGNFVKPAKIPGLQKPYNYIVNTKFLNTKQTTLRIEQFFPSNMILRGLYSSTKNISLVSKEGIVRFFNLGKTTSVKSYLYLEADPEICKIVSQNKKAYAELVSYGLCK